MAERTSLPASSATLLTWTGAGWFVGGGPRSHLAREGRAIELTTDGAVTAACFDGARTWLALAKQGARANVPLASSIAVLEGERVVPWRSLDVLGRAARAVPWMAAVDGEVIVSSSLAMEAHGGGWALHRLAASGAPRASLELQPASYAGSLSKIGRLGGRLFVDRRALCLDLVTEARPGPDPVAPMAWWAEREASLRVSWPQGQRGSEVRVVVERGQQVIEHLAPHPPTMLAVGERWVAWADARRASVALDEGAPRSLRLSGVRRLASSGAQLAALVLRTPGELELVTSTPDPR